MLSFQLDSISLEDWKFFNINKFDSLCRAVVESCEEVFFTGIRLRQNFFLVAKKFKIKIKKIEMETSCLVKVGSVLRLFTSIRNLAEIYRRVKQTTIFLVRLPPCARDYAVLGESMIPKG